MGIQRAAVINMTSLLGSVELAWGEEAKNIRWYPYRTSKVIPINKQYKTNEAYTIVLLSFGMAAERELRLFQPYCFCDLN